MEGANTWLFVGLKEAGSGNKSEGNSSTTSHASAPERAKYYPGLDEHRWYRVTQTTVLGVRIDLEHRKLFIGERFLFWQDVELRDAHPDSAGTP